MQLALRIILLFVLGGAFWVLGFDTTQTDFTNIVIGYSIGFLAFGLYLWLVKEQQDLSTVDWIGVIGLPVILVIAFPNLSDDLYRFVWDGYCVQAGISPYGELPSALVKQGVIGLDQELYSLLNSPEYYSIYPAISQIFFYLTISLNDDIFMQAMVLSLINYNVHILGGYCLYRVLKNRQLPTSVMLLYYLNPLVLVEGIGNLHAEINMVAFLFIGLYFFERKKDWLSALMIGIAIAIKMIPIFLLGYFLIRYEDRRMLRYLLKAGICTTVLFIPVIYGLVSGGFLDSIDLYFRKFEFNGSIYYLLRSLGQWLSGYNLIAYIGPGLFLVFVIHAFYRWIKRKEDTSLKSFILDSEVVLVSYFLISTIVHPWYVIGLLGLNVFLKRKYILVWSYLITLTYINYSYNEYYENLWIVALEYGVVFIVFLLERYYTSRLDNHMIKKITV